MNEARFESFEEFWPYYVLEHANKATRTLHFVGTTAAMACVAGSVLFKKRWLLAVAPVVGYGPSWISHLFIEKNRPVSFDHPLWSLRADLLMWSMIVRGAMDAEVQRVTADREKVEPARGPEAQPEAQPDTQNAGGPSASN